ncbi:Flp family type IVb pilin [Roseicella aerolata]|uniref:Flp family type IVb pilin n=1 Tax=Roseicella aerolata TaxID=2883479 RepID=A0A9X1IIN1_9PROT|nr:Flp family type IVb pilin [Roseicella aerolata]MCB4824759.1 Flp family type IVb pilin [Roseicella aerolata]
MFDTLKTLKVLVQGTLKNRDGVTALEYAIIAGVAAVSLLAGFQALYSSVDGKLSGLTF